MIEVDRNPVGFMTVDRTGYIDLAFVLPDHQGQGYFSGLFDVIETYARRQNVPRLWTHASLMAQPAFQAKGFLVIQTETVTRADQMLDRAEMEKWLK